MRISCVNTLTSSRKLVNSAELAVAGGDDMATTAEFAADANDVGALGNENCC
jgi:hypothetical protein